MKTFKITFVEECKSEVRIRANTKAKARAKVISGNFSNDKIIERDHFEIIKIEDRSIKR